MHPEVDELALLRARLAQHPVHRAVRDAAGLRTFLEHHCVCVLDFMSLLKRLQLELTGVRVPWTPPAHPELARFVNQLVLDEESDAAFGPRPASHYEWYLAAMDEVGADSAPVRELERRLRAGQAPATALAASGLPAASVAFARTTFELAAGPVHVVAATFFHGREELIPELFLPIARALEGSGTPCGLFVRYLERHIALDGEDHGPLAERLLAQVPGDRAEARAAAVRALRAREALWDAIADACALSSPAPAASAGSPR